MKDHPRNEVVYETDGGGAAIEIVTVMTATAHGVEIWTLLAGKMSALHAHRREGRGRTPCTTPA